MITCPECGRTVGSGKRGTSWICGDCRVEADKPQLRKADAAQADHDISGHTQGGRDKGSGEGSP